MTGKLTTGETLDVTRMVDWSLSTAIAEVSRSGLVRPRVDGKASLSVSLAGKSQTVPVTVLGLNTPVHVDFAHDGLAPCFRRWVATREPATARPRGKTASSSRCVAMTPFLMFAGLTDDQAVRHINLAAPKEA